MSRRRILYGGPIMEHWSHAWLRWMGTVRGLCVATALIGCLVTYQTWLDVQSMTSASWLDILPQVALLSFVARAAQHLHAREREQEGEAPDASMRVLFELAWALLVIALIV